MGKPILCTPTLGDAATLYPSSESGVYVAENVQTMALSERWRTTGDTAEYIEADLGAASAITVVAALGTNLTSAATWRVRGATSQANLTASPGYDSTSVTAWAQTGIGDWASQAAILPLASAQTYQWWRVDLVDAANPDEYIEVGRLYISAEVELAVGFGFGAGTKWVNESRIIRTRGGNAWVDEHVSFREFDGALNVLTEAEARATVSELQRARGGRKDVLLIVDPDSSYLMDESIYGVITDMRNVAKRAPSIYQSRIKITEIR